MGGIAELFMVPYEFWDRVSISVKKEMGHLIAIALNLQMTFGKILVGGCL